MPIAKASSLFENRAKAATRSLFCRKKTAIFMSMTRVAESDSTMDIDLPPEEEGKEKEKEEEEEEEGEADYFLKFIDYARSELLEDEGDPDPNGDGAVIDQPGWSWIVSRILKTCITYSSGVTPAILLSELSLAWSEQRRVGAPTKRLEFIKRLKKNHRRMKLPNTVTIDSIYEKKFLSLNSVLETVIVDAFVLPGISE